MIYSMTAYSRIEQKAEWGNAVWEIRSVNQRYLETFIRLPEQFRGLESVLRERLRQKLQRGKVEVFLKFNANPAAQTELHVNEGLALQLLQKANWVQMHCPEAQINALDVLRWPGVMDAEEADIDALSSVLLAAFDEMVEDFIACRAREGENLHHLIAQRLTVIQEQVQRVRSHMPTVVQWQRDKLLSRFAEAKLELDSSRLEQEMIITLQKIDVAEELDRLESHIKETLGILKRGGSCGRRLDFMMQEFNREANTLGSKSINADITQSAVELKVLIEQMREQIQNIE